MYIGAVLLLSAAARGIGAASKIASSEALFSSEAKWK